MPGYPVEIQKYCPIATMTLHDYVCAHDTEDVQFFSVRNGSKLCTNNSETIRWYSIPAGASASSTCEASRHDMDEIRIDQLQSLIQVGDVEGMLASILGCDMYDI